MSRSRPVVASGVALLLATGCATAPKVPVRGRSVTIVTEEAKLKGELLTVGSDRLWVRTSDGVQEVPLPSVREVRVKRHGFDARKALTWALVGGLVTGGTLAAACSSVEGAENCGVVGLVVGGAWLLVGAAAAPSMESSSRLELWRPTAEQLRAFARLPQGWPESLRSPTLAPVADDEAREP